MKETNPNDDLIDTVVTDNSDKDRKYSYQESKLSQRTFTNSIKESIKQVSNFYEDSSNILAKKIGGAESINEHDEQKLSNQESLTDLPKFTTILSMSRYEKESKRGELSFWATLFTFIKVNLVAGFLFLPCGFKNGGYLFSIIAIFIVTAFCTYCNISLSECTDPASSYSFSKIGFKAGGKVGFYMVEIGIAISQICFPCAYANLITQIMNNMLNIWLGTDENYHLYIGLCIALIVIPLCLLRNVSKLASLHFIGDLAILATVISLTYESVNIVSSDPNFNFDKIKMINTGWAKLLGMSITSLEGIGVVLPIKESMKDKNKFNLVIILGQSVIGFILMTFPLIMYMCYQDNVQEIILGNLPLNKLYIQIVLIMMIFSVIIVYPVVLYPAFQILAKIFCAPAEPIKAVKESDNLGKTDENINGVSSQPKTNLKVLIMENSMRIVIVSGTIVIGVLSINKFDTLMSLVGCGVCTPIAFIFPSIFHYILLKDKQSRTRNIIDILAAILGMTISIVVLVFTLIN